VQFVRRKMKRISSEEIVQIQDALKDIVKNIYGEVVVIIKNGEVVVDPLAEVRR
jgi:DUF4097 and DUF4098 domain-containing protein YvlB